MRAGGIVIAVAAILTLSGIILINRARSPDAGNIGASLLVAAAVIMIGVLVKRALA